MELGIQPALSYRAVQLLSDGYVLIFEQIMGAVKLGETMRYIWRGESKRRTDIQVGNDLYTVVSYTCVSCKSNLTSDGNILYYLFHINLTPHQILFG